MTFGNQYNSAYFLYNEPSNLTNKGTFFRMN